MSHFNCDVPENQTILGASHGTVGVLYMMLRAIQAVEALKREDSFMTTVKTALCVTLTIVE